MEGRWTLAPVDGDSSRALQVTASNPDVLYGEAVPVVPCDDAAVERAVARLEELSEATDEHIAQALEQDDWPHYIVREILRAAGETP